jgi:hypothetical protein
VLYFGDLLEAPSKYGNFRRKKEKKKLQKFPQHMVTLMLFSQKFFV